eukprot:COSAG06_NODE_16741_length_983_cov_1.558824_2_plen_59_part_01
MRAAARRAGSGARRLGTLRRRRVRRAEGAASMARAGLHRAGCEEGSVSYAGDVLAVVVV